MIYCAMWNVALTTAEIADLAAGASPTDVRPEALVSVTVGPLAEIV